MQPARDVALTRLTWLDVSDNCGDSGAADAIASSLTRLVRLRVSGWADIDPDEDGIEDEDSLGAEVRHKLAALPHLECFVGDLEEYDLGSTQRERGRITSTLMTMQTRTLSNCT